MQSYAWAASFLTRVLQSVTESRGEVSGGGSTAPVRGAINVPGEFPVCGLVQFNPAPWCPSIDIGSAVPSGGEVPGFPFPTGSAQLSARLCCSRANNRLG